MRSIFALSIFALTLVGCGSTGSNVQTANASPTQTQNVRTIRSYSEATSAVTALNAPASPADCQYIHITATPGLVVTLHKWNGQEVVYTADAHGILKNESTRLDYSYWIPGSVLWMTTNEKVEWSGMSFVSDDGFGATFVNSNVDTVNTHEIAITTIPAGNG